MELEEPFELSSSLEEHETKKRTATIAKMDSLDFIIFKFK
jgi:hypothetical protein